MAQSRRDAIQNDLVSVAEILSTLRLDAAGSLNQQVYRLLHRLIGQLKLLPNQFLSEKDVAEGLGISKTPVREAFIRLAEDSKVLIVPKSGTYVSPIDLKRINEGLFIWRGLEASCAERIAETATFGSISQLRDYVSLQRHCLNADDEKGFKAANGKFHDAVFLLADSPGSKEMIENAQFEIRRFLGFFKKNAFEMLDAVVNEQWQIINLMAEHKKNAVRQSMDAHLLRVKRVVDGILAQENGSQFLQRVNRKKSGTRQSRAGSA